MGLLKINSMKENISCFKCGSDDTLIYPNQDNTDIVIQCNSCGFKMNYSIDGESIKLNWEKKYE